MRVQYAIAGNRCLPGDTLIATPLGPIRLAALRVGDTVYDEVGKEQTVVRTWDNGPKEVGDLLSRGRVLASCTAEHKWWTTSYSRETGEETSTQKCQAVDLGAQRAVRRTYTTAPLGCVAEPHAYAIGALLGDGCSRQPGRQLYISSSDALVPTKVAALLGGEARKRPSANYTWVLGRLECNHYQDWCHGRYAHEKTVDLSTIQGWNRPSLVAFVAGLMDTDGSVFATKQRLSFQLGMQAKPVVDAFCWAMLALWNVQMDRGVDARDKYKNGPLYIARTSDSRAIRRVLLELGEQLVKPSRKWQAEWEGVGGRRSRPDSIKLSWGTNRRTVPTYDITVSGTKNLYLLANGLVSSNSGKTQMGARIMAWMLAENKPGWTRPAIWGPGPLQFMMIGRVSKQVEEVLFRKVRAFFKEGELHETRVGNALQKVTHKGTGNVILCASHHNASEAREKVQAYELHGLWLDEMPNDVRLLEEIDRRLQDRHGFLFTSFTPKVRNLAIRKKVDAVEAPMGRHYKMRMFDNPIYTDQDKADILKSLEGMPESYRKCVLEGDWMEGEESAYSVPDKFYGDCEGYSSGWRHVESADPALQSKHGQVVFAEDPRTGFWWIVRDDYIEGIYVPEDLVTAVVSRTKGMQVVRRVCDPASTWYIGQASKMGFQYTTPWDKSNRRPEMMKNLQAAMGVSLFCAPWCQNLPNELGAMEWSENQEARIVNSHKYHLHDATIYGLDCLPKRERGDAPVPELHVRLRMKMEQDRKKAGRNQERNPALQPFRISHRRRRGLL